jgi:DNA modification methylase
LSKLDLTPKPQLKSKSNLNKFYNYPPDLILNIEEYPEKELIYGKEIRDITHFTEKFKGRMLTNLTHGLYIYPAKFIPQIPQFCIRQFSEPNDTILDPFCGSGTSLVEALLLHRNAFGLDINPLAQLISKVKTSSLDLFLLLEECTRIEHVLTTSNTESIKNAEILSTFPNIAYWFSPKVFYELLNIQQHIFKIQDVAIRNFFLLILASIVRDVSFADRDQLHPARTKYTHKNEAVNVPTYAIFRKSLQLRLPIIETFSQFDFSNVSIQLIGEDATRIRCPIKIDLAVTSPPYVNAVDYARIHKLEAFWTGLLNPKEIASLHQQYIGTENVYKEYYSHLPEFPHPELNQLIAQIASFDKKRAGIVALYFTRMFQNLQEVFRLLKSAGYYCIVIGSNNIRNIHIPTPKILIDFAENELGYKNTLNYSYNVINKRLKIPRAQHGGNIKKEWIVVLQKL